MATAEEFHAYAASLPDIYREIMAAFPRIEPTRRRHFSLAFQSLWADFEERGLGITLGELIEACQQLAGYGFVEIKRGMFVHPTERGERLIGAITGNEAPRAKVPVLPPPPN